MLTREEYISAIVTLTPDFTASAFDGWEVIPGFIKGKHAGTLIAKGSEVHFGLVPEYRTAAVLRDRTADFLRPVFERFGFLTTRVNLESHKQKRFVARMGFEPTWSDGQVQFYMMSNLPFERKQK